MKESGFSHKKEEKEESKEIVFFCKLFSCLFYFLFFDRLPDRLIKALYKAGLNNGFRDQKDCFWTIPHSGAVFSRLTDRLQSNETQNK
jgi:hypothetical protein